MNDVVDPRWANTSMAARLLLMYVYEDQYVATPEMRAYDKMRQETDHASRHAAKPSCPN